MLGINTSFSSFQISNCYLKYILSAVISNFERDGDEIQNEDCYMTHLSCMKEY